jgi:hypothetical protein
VLAQVKPKTRWFAQSMKDALLIFLGGINQVAQRPSPMAGARKVCDYFQSYTRPPRAYGLNCGRSREIRRCLWIDATLALRLFAEVSQANVVHGVDVSGALPCLRFD